MTPNLLIAGIIMPSTQLWIDAYMGYDSGGSSLSIGYLERLLSGILLFCYIDKLRKQREDGNIFINSIAIYLFLYLLHIQDHVLGYPEGNA